MEPRRPTLVILLTAICVLLVLSLCPWNRWTGGRLKDFGLFSDLLPRQQVVPADNVADNIDPELMAFVAEQTDTVAASDTVAVQSAKTFDIPKGFKAPRIDGAVAIEDYSPDGKGLERLAATLAEASGRRVRIAMVGDSYIEGDILAQDIRAGLQSRYGGCGVGYMAAFSPFPGFRSSVNQAASGWEEHEIRKMKNDPLRTILGTYHRALPGADSRFRKSVKPAHLDAWQRTSVIFKADTAGTITFAGPDFPTESFAVSPSQQIQCITLEQTVSDVRFMTDVPSLKVLGFWLEGNAGIVLDGISLRGNSGVSHRELNEQTTRRLRDFIDYDLIILEFGMNALSASQTDYTAYGNAMVEVVNNLKRLYPNARVLIFGVGDRGQKVGMDIGSMPTVEALVRVQRNVAVRTGSLFWDTREAMGGDGAAVDWHRRKLVNSDYVHLNHRGGRELADIFLNSLDHSLQQ